MLPIDRSDWNSSDPSVDLGLDPIVWFWAHSVFRWVVQKLHLRIRDFIWRLLIRNTEIQILYRRLFLLVLKLKTNWREPKERSDQYKPTGKLWTSGSLRLTIFECHFAQLVTVSSIVNLRVAVVIPYGDPNGDSIWWFHLGCQIEVWNSNGTFYPVRSTVVGSLLQSLISVRS